MNRRKAASSFVGALAELSASRMTVTTLIKYMAAMNGLSRPVREIAGEISGFLEKGYGLSAAFSLCAGAEFSPEDTALLLCAEETGNYGEAFRFLSETHRQKKDAQGKFALCAAYPAFIFCLVTAATAGILANAKTLFPLASSLLQDPAFRASMFGNVAGACAFLLLAGAVCLAAAFRVIRLPGVYYVFSSLAFLTAAGIDVQRAIGQAIPGAAKDSRLSGALLRVQDAMKAGASMESAFGAERLFDRERFLLETASANGAGERAFTLIARHIEERQRKRERLFLQIIEPAMLAAAGIYMLVILRSTIMPLMLNFGGVL